MTKPLPRGATVLLVKNGASTRVRPECVEGMKEDGWVEPAAPADRPEPEKTAPAKMRVIGSAARQRAST